MISDLSTQAVWAGFLAAIVGFGSSFAVVIGGLLAVGASDAEATSGLMAAAVAMGLAGIVMAARTRMPIAAAWSTPGAALLVTLGPIDGGFGTAVGAFLVSGALIVVAGLWKPLARWVAMIPPAIAAAMLAGVLLALCLAPVRAIASTPEFAAPIIATWAVVSVYRKLWAVPAASVVAIGIVAIWGAPLGDAAAFWPAPVIIRPDITIGALVSIALPLFVVTMASQNVPGMAVLNVHGYKPNAGPNIATTGVFSMLAAPFGGHAVNLSAIVAALCAGEDAHANPARRYWAAISMGVFSVLLGLMAGLVVAVVKASPPLLIETIAGLALLGPFAASVKRATENQAYIEPAAVTFVVAASGVSIAGIGGAFWGLVAGIAMLGLKRLR